MLRQNLPTRPIPEEVSPVLVAGATGYVGDRLVPRLLDRGYHVRALGRTARKLDDRGWSNHERLESVSANVLDRDELREAVEGVQSVYYLVHSLQSAGDEFEDADRRGAENMVHCAREASVRHLIYLGGLGRESDELSPHLQSRAEVARVFAESGLTTTILRAGIILGSGSSSFEILRYLVERLPAMITPRWVETKTQPIGIRNVLSYLVGVLEHPRARDKDFDIGGADVLTYLELMRLYAEVAGLPRRLIIPVPVLTPRLSSWWIHLVTPVPTSIARPLVDGLKNPTVCEETSIRELIPVEVLSARRSIELALERIDEGAVESRWSDAGSLPAEAANPGDPEWAGGTVLSDVHEVILEDHPDKVWDTIARVGGQQGWYGIDILWKVRGWIDRLIGGVGHSRGRRDPENLNVGDALDFWRVTSMERPHYLSLNAEMKLPGTATLTFTLESLGDDRLQCRQRAEFVPSGLMGLVYWWAVYPFHHFVFHSMLKGIARRSGLTIHAGPRRVDS